MQVETLVVGAIEENCHVVIGPGRQALVIDPGAEAERILEFLVNRKLAVAAYLLTHGHTDHIGALAGLHRSAPAPAAMHADDLTWAFGAGNQLPPFYTQPERPAGEMRGLAGDERFAEGGFACEVLCTPGHTPGSVSFYFPSGRTVFTGDTLFAGSVGRTDLPRGDARALARSLARLARLPDETRVFAGHGPETTIGEEKRSNYFLRQP